MATSDDTVARAHLDLVEGLRFTASFPDAPGAEPLAIDEAPPLGSGAGPTPAATLAAAVGSCLAASLVFCLKKARIAAASVSADAAAHISRNAAGRFRIDGIDVNLGIAVSESDASRLDRCREIFEDFCIVTESVRHGIPVDVHLSTRPAESLVEG
jgi:uncharacterized OsmC-like protein